MKKILLLALLLPFFFKTIHAQADSIDGQGCKLRISLLTCSPGVELYETWGHSALRVVDSATNNDLVYNYGTFDFDDPSFYSKFVRGKLLYFVSVDQFQNFVQEYTYFHRGITEQVLNLDCAEKSKLMAALNVNAKEENKYYLYDFISDNCTTRLRDMVFNNSGGGVETKNILSRKDVTFRDLIHQYLDSSHQYWSELGIDILLGKPLDKKVTNEEAMFLPDYLMKGFDNTTLSGKPLVAVKDEILHPALPASNSAPLSPFFSLFIFFILVIILSVFRRATKFFSVFDFLLYFITGLLGLLLLFMWFGTNHPECRYNFNIAWAMPLNFGIVFFLYKKKNWVRFYFLGYSMFLLLLLVTWRWLPQEMNNALIPIICVLLFRSLTRSKKLSNG